MVCYKEERMRLKERIPTILKLFQSEQVKRKYLHHLFPVQQIQLNLFYKYPFELIDQFLGEWIKKEDMVAEFWYKNPNFRLTQVLTSLSIIPSVPGVWYAEEETDYIVQNRLVELREILVWGQNYDAIGNQLPETKHTLIKDMSTDHIKAILSDYVDGKLNINDYYLETFSAEIKRRKKDGK